MGTADTLAALPNGSPSRRHGLKRRSFLCAGLAAVAVPGLLTGYDASPLAPFDRCMEQFMAARGIPGGTLALLHQGRLIYARGYGWAHQEERIPVQPTTLFRLASLSKPLTALTLLRLAQAKRLSLDEPAFDRLGLAPLPGKNRDPRLTRISIRHLLQHTAGWDATLAGDPMFMSRTIAKACGVPSPPGPRDIIRFMLGRPLDFEPGSRYAYSNFGYCVLGRVVEAVTGHPYETWVQRDLLSPLGIRAMRLGRSLLRDAHPGETRYYMADHRTAPSVFEKVPSPVPAPYGSFCLEAMDAHGGWVGSVVDLMRLSAALSHHNNPLLQPQWHQEMAAPPAPPVARDASGRLHDAYYGCGWLVRPTRNPGGYNLWHSGSLPGTFAFWVILSHGLAWAVLFNQRREGEGLADAEIDGLLHRAAAEVTEWPDTDEFPRYASPPA